MNDPSIESEALGPIPAEKFLARIQALVDWEALVPAMEQLSDKFGQKLPLSVVRIALLRRWYALEDVLAEFTILDRLSFRAFVGFSGDGSSADVEILNELRDGAWSSRAELRAVLESVEQQLRGRGFTVQRGYITEASIAPSTEGELAGIESTATIGPHAGKRNDARDGATAKAHARGRTPTGPQPMPERPVSLIGAGDVSLDLNLASGEQQVKSGRVRAQIEWPWGQRSDLIDVLQIGRDYAYSPFARELIPYTHVSRQHAELLVQGDSVWIRDLGSRNGTYVNNEEVPRGQAFLIDADAIVRFGPLLAVSLKILD